MKEVVLPGADSRRVSSQSLVRMKRGRKCAVPLAFMWCAHEKPGVVLLWPLTGILLEPSDTRLHPQLKHQVPPPSTREEHAEGKTCIATQFSVVACIKIQLLRT